MSDPDLRRERTQNLWTSYERKLPLLSRAAQMDPAPTTSFDAIGGLASAKEELETYACAATHPDVYGHWGTFPPSGLLLIGQRGVGKTLLASALAARTDTGFLRITVPRLVIELLHAGGKAGELVETWSQALNEMPSITVFFEELEFLQTEELGARRADLPQGPIMDFLLDLIDRTIEASSTLVIASTAHPETLRRAFVMAGRFERIVEVVPVFPDDIVAALELHVRDAEKRAGRALFEQVEWTEVVKQFREPSTGDWIRLMHATLRRKARCEAAGDIVTPVRTQDLLEEVERSRRARRQLPAEGGGIYL
jgi:ATP-dependent 26S proteasome regulatory subunit